MYLFIFFICIDCIQLFLQFMWSQGTASIEADIGLAAEKNQCIFINFYFLTKFWMNHPRHLPFNPQITRSVFTRKWCESLPEPVFTSVSQLRFNDHSEYALSEESTPYIHTTTWNKDINVHCTGVFFQGVTRCLSQNDHRALCDLKRDYYAMTRGANGGALISPSGNCKPCHLITNNRTRTKRGDWM